MQNANAKLPTNPTRTFGRSSSQPTRQLRELLECVGNLEVERQWRSTKSACRSWSSKAVEQEERDRVALRGRFEVKLCGGQAEVLPAPPAYPNDLPSVHWEKGWKRHNSQAQEKVVKMG